MRNLFGKAVARHSDRVAQLDSPTREQLMQLLPGDLKEPEEADPAGSEGENPKPDEEEAEHENRI